MTKLNPTAVLNIVGLTPSLIGEHTPKLKAFRDRNACARLQEPFPAVTCTSQATILTGKLPQDHGIVGNGWYFRDLSEVLFVCTANAVDGLSAPLRDRLEIIELSGYTMDEKFDIARKHLLPKALKEYALETPGAGRVSVAQGAQVLLDHEDKGVTPTFPIELPAGKKVVLELKKEGFEPFTGELTSESGEHRLSYDLKALAPAKVKVHLDTAPSGAQVFLAQGLLGKTPMDWEVEASDKPVELQFKLAGYKAATQLVACQAGAQVKVELSKLPKQQQNPKEPQDPVLQIKTGR